MSGQDWSLTSIAKDFVDATSARIHMARVFLGMSTTNTKVVRRSIRIRVLDCRSAQPIKRMPVKAVKVDGVDAVRYAWVADDWDLSKHVTFGNNAGTINWNGTYSQRALVAMGYPVGGRPTTSYGPAGRAAFQQFQSDLHYGQDFVGPRETPQGLNLVETPTEEWRKRIVNEYNKRVFAATQRHLIAMGFLKSEDLPKPGVWNGASKIAFKRWQLVEMGQTAAKAKRYPYRKAEGKKLHEARRHFYTDYNGDLRIPISIKTLRSASYTIEIAFAEFAVVAEALESQREKTSGIIHRKIRSDAMPELAAVQTPYGDRVHGTGFSVEWTPGSQQTGDNQPWGWRLALTPAQTDQERKKLAEFRTSWVFKDIPGFGPSGDINFTKLHKTKKCFNMFYPKDEDAPDMFMPEFVLFALQWCQPTWQEQPSGSHLIRGDYTSSSPTERVGEATRFILAAATSHRGREDPNNAAVTPAIGGGREYGRFIPNPTNANYTRWSSKGAPRRHTGFDIWGLDGQTPVFAIHGGIVARRYLSQQGFGHSIISRFSHDNRRWYIRFAHLASQPSASDGQKIMAGQNLATMGQTFNGTGTHGYPIHLHLELSPRQSTQKDPRVPWSELASGVDLTNLKACFPDNGAYHKFPCDCPSTAYSSQKCRLRGGSSDAVASQCWASRQLRCPWLVGTQRTQAQLVFLHEQTGSPYLRPGGVTNQINGTWTTNHMDAIQAFREENRGAIGDLPDPPAPLGPNPTSQQTLQHQQQTQQFNAQMRAQPQAGSETTRELDRLAPLPRP